MRVGSRRSVSGSSVIDYARANPSATGGVWYGACANGSFFEYIDDAGVAPFLSGASVRAFEADRPYRSYRRRSRWACRLASRCSRSALGGLPSLDYSEITIKYCIVSYM